MVVKTVAVGSDAAGVAITPDGAFADVMNLSDNTFSMIHTASNEEVARVAVAMGAEPRGVAITPNPEVNITVTPDVSFPFVVPA